MKKTVFIHKRRHIISIAITIAVLCIQIGCNGVGAKSPLQGAGNASADGALTDGSLVGNASADGTVSDKQSGATTPEIEEVYDTAVELDKLPIARALVAKMMALALWDKSEIDGLDREIEFTDTDAGQWFDKYINSMVIGGVMSGSGNGIFSPDAPLTVSQAQILIDKLDPNNRLKIKITDENKNEPISYALWVDLYLRVLNGKAGDKTLLQEFGISERELIILATPANNTELNAWNLVSDNGPYSFAGLGMDSYIDKKVRVLVKDGEILADLDLAAENPTITNCYIVAADSADNIVTIYVGGVKRSYKISETQPDLAARLTTGSIADITINNKLGTCEVSNISGDRLTGVLKQADYSGLELEGTGYHPVLDDAKFYAVTGEAVKWRSIKDFIVGSDIGEFVVKNGSVCAGLITKEAVFDKIRVALSTTSNSSYTHGAVEITSETAFTVSDGESITDYQAGTSFTAVAADYAVGGKRMYISPKDANGRLIVKSISRSGSAPKYRGVLEVAKIEEGLTIVNELPFDEYLYAVVPSEMPTSYGLTAAKAQAVTARSYARSQFYSNAYHKYGGNVDDTVQCQVYNNIPETDISIQAVNQTKDEYLTYNGQIISANFFSTSCGTTANSGDVWAAGSAKVFPAETLPYLRSTRQFADISNKYADLSDEAIAAIFFNDNSIVGYDSGFSWFRWNVTMTAAELSAAINANIGARYAAVPKLVKTLQPEGIYRSRTISDIGDIVDIEVQKRGSGGNIMSIVITGTQATVLVQTEYNVRTVLRPKQYVSGGAPIPLNRKDGSVVNDYPLMPSAFFTIEKSYGGDGKLSAVKFIGGGNGHGVGMSQNGVKGMADAGNDYKQILSHYYSGTEVKAITE